MPDVEKHLCATHGRHARVVIRCGGQSIMVADPDQQWVRLHDLEQFIRRINGLYIEAELFGRLIRLNCRLANQSSEPDAIRLRLLMDDSDTDPGIAAESIIALARDGRALALLTEGYFYKPDAIAIIKAWSEHLRGIGQCISIAP